MTAKTYLSAQQLLEDSFQLGADIIASGFKPTIIIAIWRGGTPMGIAVQEMLAYAGIETDHIAIRTSHYTGIDQTSESVIVHGLHYLIENVNADDRVLIVDDVFDSGRSIQQVIWDLEKKCRRNTPTFKIATPYFKPTNNKTELVPDFFLHESNEWLVFPHELEGLSAQEVQDDKPGLGSIRDRLVALHQG